jgi:hypothetical protein
MRTRIRTATVVIMSAGAFALGTGTALADDAFAPGPDYTNFQPGPDYTNFQPGPDYTNFEPGANPGTAELVDDNAATVLGSLLGGLFG